MHLLGITFIQFVLKLSSGNGLYKDNLKASLKELEIDTESWEASATNRAKWCSKIFTGVIAAETTRLAEAKHKRAVRKERSHSSFLITPRKISFWRIIFVEELKFLRFCISALII